MIKLWDAGTGRETTPRLSGHGGGIESVAFSPDGRSLAAIGFTPDLVLWELPSGKSLRTWKGGGGLGRKVRLSPDGR